jgi:Ca2+/Na+ antiporter
MYEEACIAENYDNNFQFIAECYLYKNPILIAIFSMILIGVAFYLLASTACTYLSPALSRLSSKLGISETLAGVTLLAFANGAPDVISSFAAGEGIEGVPLVVGAIFGAGLFVMAVVSGIVILTTKKLRVLQDAFVRDIVFYLIATLYLILLGWIGKIHFIMAFGFIIMYAVYVYVVVKQEKQQSEDSLDGDLKKMESLKDEEESFYPHEGAAKGNGRPSQFKRRKPHESDDDIEDTESELIPESEFNKHKKKAEVIKEVDPWIRINEWKDTFMKYFEIPFNFIRDITIPVVEEERWNKMYMVVYPITLLWFWLYSTGYFSGYYDGFWIGVFTLPFQLLASYLVWKDIDEFEKPPETPIYTLFSLLNSVLWINLVAGFVVSFLEYMGVITKLPVTFLGMTVLAWGNSIGDVFADKALAEVGLGLTAITGAFAGPLFNLLVGFGSHLIRETLGAEDGAIKFEIFDFSEKSINEGGLLALMILGSSIAFLVITLLYAHLNRYNLQRNFAIFMIAFYGVFFIVSVMYAFSLK